MNNDGIFSDYIIEDEPEEKEVQAELFEADDLPDISFSGKKKTSGRDKKKSRSQDSGNTEENNADQELIDQARSASYKKTVHDQEIKSIKLQRERIQLMKDSEEVGEIAFFDFCFVSYMEKMNIDSYKMIDRIEPRILTLVNEKKGGAIIEMIKKELNNVIKSVKIAQANEVKRWNAG